MLVMAPEHGENLLCFGTISCGFLSFFFFKKKKTERKSKTKETVNIPAETLKPVFKPQSLKTH